MREYRLAIIPGDGIGPEVVTAGVRVLQAVADRHGFALRLEWLGDHRHVMGLCLLLGAVHLTVAHVWNAISHSGSPAALAQLGWIGVVWTLFFVARTMLLNMPFPRVMIGVGVVGLAAVILFMTPLRRLKTDWPNHAMLPLTLMSNFGDVLSYLRLFEMDTLKIDRGFVCALDEPGGSSLRIVEAVVRLAHGLGLAVVAEGVETAQQRDTLQAVGCDQVQGYLYARPVEGPRLVELLRGPPAQPRSPVRRPAALADAVA